MYLAWFDADRKKPVAQKIAEAHERYVAKFGRQPLVCLVNPEDAIEGMTVEVRPLKHIGRNCFWIGADDSEEAVRSPEVTVAVAKPEDTAPAAKPARRVRKAASQPEAAPAVAVLPEPTPVVAPARTRARKAAPPVAIEPAPIAATTRTRPRKVAAPAAPAPQPIAATLPAEAPAKRRPRREHVAA